MPTKSTITFTIRGTVHRRYFSLIEMLAYIAALSVVAVFLSRLFHSTTKLNRYAQTRAHRYQTVSRLHKQWKSFVSETTPADWRAESDTGFFTADKALKIDVRETWINVRVYPSPEKKEDDDDGGAVESFDFFGGPPPKPEKAPEPSAEAPPQIKRVCIRRPILVMTDAKARRELPLPDDATLNFSVETDSVSQWAVLTLSFPPKPGFKKETIRLVATSTPKGGE